MGKARKYELERHSVILCTCSCSASGSLKGLRVRQILIDEAGMATEPETLIPLVCFSRVEKVRLGGSGAALWVPGGGLCCGAEGARGEHRSWLKMTKTLGCLWLATRMPYLSVLPGGSAWRPQTVAACGQE